MNPVVSSSKSAAQSALNGAAIGATQNKVLRNTYTLLAMTLLLSAATAAFAIAIQAKPLGLLPIIAGYFGLLFLTHRTSGVRVRCQSGLRSTLALDSDPIFS
jgi:modulator of FtsH protease